MPTNYTVNPTLIKKLPCLNRRIKHDFFNPQFKLVFMFVLLLFSSRGWGQVTKTVGASGADYTTLKLAFDAINAGTITAPGNTITLNVIASTTETASAVLNASGSGSASYGSILIQPSGGGARTISGAITAGSPLIDLNGADNVTIDGLNTGSNSLTIVNTTVSGTASTSTIRFIADATSNIIQNCTIQGSSTGTAYGTTLTTANILFSTGTASGNDGNQILNNNITSNGTSYATQLIASYGSSTSISNDNITISGNNLYNFFATTGMAAINVGSNSSAWTIASNKIYQSTNQTTLTSGNYLKGIVINTSSGGGYSVSSNIIGYNSSAGTGMLTNSGGRFTGIEITSVAASPVSSIQGNTINGINWTTASGASTLGASPFNGIYVGAGGVNIGTSSGNTIGASSGVGSSTNGIYITSTTNGTGIFPIYVTSSTACTISNNNIGAIATGGTATIGYYFGGIATAGLGNHTISTNNVGNSSANTIAIGVSGTTTALITTKGIWNSGSGVISISSNVVNNINCYSSSASTIIRGIENSSGTPTINLNTVSNLTSNCTNASFTSGGLAMIGIYLGTVAGTSPIISSNTIFNLSLTNTGTGGYNLAGISYTAPSTSISVTGNRIYGLSNASTSTTSTSPGTASGIFIRDASTVTNTISNNMISLGNSQSTNTSFIGIWAQYSLSSSGPINIIHNTINIEGTVTSGAQPSFSFLRGDFSATAITVPTVSILNNIFINNRSGGTGKHYSIGNGYAATTSSATGWGSGASNYNVLNTASSATLGYWSGDKTFSAWKTASSSDANSFNGITVTFSNSANNLHLNMGTTPTQIESGGTSTSVSTDFDSQTRPGPSGSVNGGGTAPDIGADEFDGYLLDLIAPTITYTTISNTLCTNGPSLSATITDASGVNSTTGTAPRLYFKKSSDANNYVGNTSADNGWKYVEASNASSPFSFTINGSLLQSAIAAGDVIQYFVTAQDNASTPNVGITSGTFAATPSSVALTSAAFPIGGTINSYSVLTPIATSVTIGASGTYTSITGASNSLFAAINAGGLSANTVATIIDANVTETGATALNQINYGCGGSVTLTIKPQTTSTLTGSNAGGLIVLNGADNVIIDGSNNGSSSRDLTITNTNTGTSSAVVWLQSVGTNGATSNTIKNCNIVGNAPTSTLMGIGSGNSTISATSLGTNNNNNTFQNNNISKVQYAIYSQGNSAGSKNSGNLITQNLINTASPNQVSKSGILVGFEDNVSISNNNISNISGVSTSYAWAINLGALTSITTTAPTTGNEVTNATVSGNVISSIRAANTYGVGGIIISPSTSGINLIANNMLSDVAANGTSGDCGIGIMIAGGSGSSTRVYYNSVSMSGSLTGGSGPNIALAVSNNPVIDIKNNILSSTGSTGTGPNRTIALNYSTYSNLTSNYNDLLVSGGGATAGIAATGGWAGTAQVALSNWQTTTSQDANSVNIAPVFVSATDMHLVPGSNISLNDLGTPLASVTTDIDGTSRSATPDMGADEFTPPQDDAGVTASSATYCPGLQNVQVTLNNFGLSTLTSATITWSLNGVAQTPYSWTGSIASGASSVITLGTFTFVGSTNYVLVAASSNPNGNVDGSSSNDTYTSSTFQTALSGTIAVGSSGIYSTLTAAVNAANSYGLCGPTIFTLIDNSYTTPNETLPITINQLAGSSSVNTLTIKPASGVTTTITGSSASSIIKLNGADYVTIDGSNAGTTSRDLTISNSNTGTSSAVIWIASASAADGATNNTVKNSIITGNAANTTLAGIVSSSGTTITSAADFPNSNNLYQNNSVSTSYYGIIIFGATSATESGNSLLNNSVGSSTSANKIGLQGIYVANQSGLNISNNTVFGVTSSTNINTAGIYVVGTMVGGTIAKNNIYDIKNTTAAGRQAMGIWLASSSTSIGMTLSNNMIFDVANSAGNATLSRGAHGIYISSGGGYNLYFNSVNINTDPTASNTAGNNAGLYVASGVSSLDVRNNIFANSQTTSVNRYAIYSEAANTVFSNINYNNYYSSGTYLGYIGLTNRTALTDIVNGFGGNANSISVNPPFVSSTNLHLNTSGTGIFSFYVTGGSGTGISTDIDGDTRAANPCIGADEFTPPQDDAGVTASSATYCPGLQNVQVTLNNFGLSTLTSATITWSLNGVAQTPYSWTGSIASGASSVITLGTFTFVGSTNYVLVAASSNPNGNVDGNSSNDTYTSATFQTALSGTITVGSSGIYSTLTAAVNAANSYGLCGPTIFTLTDNSYTTPNETFPITINQLAGSSSVNTLTIKPATGVTTTISGSSTVSILRINGGDYIIIDGSNNSTTSRDLTIANTSTGASSAVIWLQTATSDGATNNTVKNCNVSGSGVTQTLFGIGSGASSISTTSLGTGNNSNTFSNNNITGVQYGIYTQGASIANKNSGIIISNNSINTSANTKGGIWVGFENNILINGNSISNIALSGTTDVFGISCGFGTGYSSTTSSGNEVTNATITNNIIGSVQQSNTYSAVGIGVSSATSGTTLIANNMVYGVAGNGTSGDFSSGIVLGGGAGSITNVYHNTITMQGTIPGASAATQTSACLSVTNSTAPTLDIRDNIFSNTQLGNTSATVRFACIALGYSSYTTLTSNYNNLWCAGAGPGTYQIGITGTVVAGTNSTALSNWQTTTGKDANSVNYSPTFTSSTDLHLSAASNCPLDGKGTPILSITTDYDGAARNSTTPDIGADEFNPNLPTITGTLSACMASTTSLTGSGTAAISTPWVSSNTSIATVNSTNPVTVTGVAPGTVSISYTDNASCVQVASVTINQPSTTQTVSGTSIANGDYLWNGNTSTDGSVASNWYVLNNANYTTATTAPTASDKVFIVSSASSGGCVSSSNYATSPASGTFNANGFYLGSGATFNMGSGSTLVVKGDFINAGGNFNAGSETVTFNGTSAQTIGGNTSTTFYNLTVDNTAGLTVSKGFTVNNELKFTNGNITAASSSEAVTFETTGFVSTTTGSVPADGKCIVGYCKKNTNSTTKFTFPVGSSTVYRPASITPSTSDATTWTTNYVNQGLDNFNVTGANIDHVSRLEYWNIQRTGASPSNATIELTWNTNSVPGTNFSDMIVAHYTGSAWETAGGNGISGTTASGVVSSDANWSSFSPFTLGSKSSANPLPVVLTDFTAVCNQDKTQLKWVTQSEINNDYFTIERSKDGSVFNEIGRVKGNGTTNQQNTYQFYDEQSVQGTSYYRLSQFDFNGVIKVYPIKSVICANNQNAIRVYPNPSKGIFEVAGIEEGNQLIITDVLGKKIASITCKSIKEKVQLNELKPGVYFIETRDSKGTVNTQKIIIE